MKVMARFILGSFLIIFGVIAAFASTYATIIPIQANFTGSKKYVITVIFIIIQITALFLSMVKNYIGKIVPQHFLLVDRLTNFLMIVSILSTITFFSMGTTITAEHEKTISEIYRVVPFLGVLPFYKWILDISTNIIFIWAVCIILDVLAVKAPLIGFDVIFKIQNKTIRVTIFTMIFTILTHRPKMIIQNKYKAITEQNNSEQITELQTEITEQEIQNNKNAAETITGLQNIETKPVLDDSVLFNEGSVFSEQVENENTELQNSSENTESNNAEIQNNIINFRTKDNSALNEITAQITEYLFQNYRPNEKIKSFEKKFELKITDYRKIQNMLKIQNIIYTEKCYMYLKDTEEQVK